MTKSTPPYMIYGYCATAAVGKVRTSVYIETESTVC